MYTVAKQQVQLSIDPDSKYIKGLTRIFYTLNSSLNSQPQAIKFSIFAKELQIIKIWTKNKTQIPFLYPNPLTQANMLGESLENTRDFKDLTEMLYVAWDYENELGGLLNFVLPEDVVRGKSEIAVYIEYTISNPAGGLRFYSSEEKSILLTDSLHETKRHWMPCYDSIQSKYDVELELQVPKGYYAISSGDLTGLIEEGNKNSFQYKISTFIDAIGFCVAPFNIFIQDTTHSSIAHYSFEEPNQQNRQEYLRYTINNPYFSYGNIITYLTEMIGSQLPYKSHKVVFLPDLGESLCFAGLNIIDVKYLINETMHEGINATAKELIRTCCFNWMGATFRMMTWADYWMIIGLKDYLARSYIGDRQDGNWLKFDIMKKVKRYCSYVEKGLELRPLCSLYFSHPNELKTDRVYKLKAGLIFHMIESKVGKVHIKNVIQTHLNTRCATHELIKTLKKHCKVSFKEFAKTWIYGTGAPLLQCKFTHNKKNNALDLEIQQTPLINTYLESIANKQYESLGNSNYEVPVRLNSMRFYNGPLIITIYETDGYDIDSFQREINVEGEHFYTQIPCKKRIKRPTNTKRREETEEEKLYRMMECPVLWVRVDPDFQILRKVDITQSDFMWIEQMKKERDDVLAQYDAIKAAKKITSDYANVLNLLNEILENKNYYYRVRTRAAKTLAAISYPINAYKGLDFLIYYFKKNHYEHDLLKANNFNSAEEYFVDKAVLQSIIKVNDMSLTHNYTRIKVNSSFVVEFLAEILRNNDNSTNFYDDSHWKANILHVIASTTNPIYVDQILEEITRNCKLDLALPSKHYIITTQCLKGLLKLNTHHKVPLDNICQFFLEKLDFYPPEIQSKILNFLISYSTKQQASAKLMFQLILKRIKLHHEHIVHYLGSLWFLLETISSSTSNDSILTEIRGSEEIRTVLWDLCTSPLSSADHRLMFAFWNIYRYYFPRSWKNEILDPAWREKQDADKNNQQRLEAIDISKGAWEDWAQEILNRLVRHDYSTPFLEPVDYVTEGLFDYPEIVTHPMDFSTIQTKLKNHEYSNFYNFSGDVRLVFDNCRSYNAEGCELYRYAETLDECFRVLSRPIEEHLGKGQPEVRLKLRIFGRDVKVE